MQSQRSIFLDTLRNLGWVINVEKSSLNPGSTKTFIGYKITTGDKPILRIPNERIHRLRKDIKRALAQQHVSARILARIAGQCVSMAKAVLPAKLLLRSTYRLLASKKDWSDLLIIDPATKQDLEWWLQALKSWNGAPIHTGPVDFQMETDASMTGWGAMVKNTNQAAAGFWNHRLSQMPSNYREMMAVLLGLKSLTFPTGKRIQVLTDNITTAAYINHLGGPSQDLSQLASAIWMEAHDKKTHTKCTIPERLPQYDSGRPLETFRTLRMATQQGPVSVFKSYVRPTHNRPLRNAHKHTVTQLQQQVRGSVFFGDRRPRPKGLGQAQQFCESTIQNDSTSFEGHRGTRGKSNPNSTMVASATVVSKAETIVDKAPLKATQNGTHTGAQNNAGGMQKQEMAHICLETMWANHTTELQWPSRASQQISCCLAPSTLSAYNSMLRQLHAFCDRGHIQFPPMHTKDVAQFLCELADKSQAPRSQIKVAMSAMTHMFANYGVRNLFQDYHLKILIDALVKSGTQVPMNRSKVMPIRPFRELFNKWPVNGDLSVKELRLKAITLLALTLMLRPSDIAPKAVHFDSSLGTTTAFVFSTDHVEFCNDGANITLHGIKNDTTRTGFAVFLQPTKEAKLNPVQALRDYIDCTQQVRPPAKPVFLTLTAPYKAISASTVATILNEAIKLAGLDGMGYSAKSFRPTGATAAIDMHCDPDIAMRLGRWKTRSVFYEHYVHSKPPASLSSDIIELHQ